MKYLLDTHVFLWIASEPSRLSAPATKACQSGQLWLSVASIWEMLIKVGLGKLPLPIPATEYVTKQMERNRIGLLPIRVAHLAELEKLPYLHRDPFDRILIAQARAEKMRMLTADDRMREYGVEVT